MRIRDNMFIVLVTLFAAAAAAPQYFHQQIHHGAQPFLSDQRSMFPHPFFADDIFDTRRFWSELSSELRGIDNMLADFYKRFPTSVSSEGVDGDKYKITIPLNGFEEKDIIVKAREGLLMVQAVRKYDDVVVKNYLDVRSLPDCVNVTGSWTYDKGILKIVFPLKPDAVTEQNTVVTEGPVFEAETESREQIEPTESSSNIQDADVGLKRGDETEQDRQILTNEIEENNVEATTYAVDLKGDVEFVPVRY